jgi:hypothetical protein
MAGCCVSFVVGLTDPAGDVAIGSAPVPSVEVAVELLPFDDSRRPRTQLDPEKGSTAIRNDRIERHE